MSPDLVNGLVYLVVFLFSVTLHEAAHAWAAKLGGDLTAYHGGQVSLDPIPHIKREPIGMLVLPLVSVIASGWPLGFASAPYDPIWAREYPKRAALMALAGPAANLLVVLIAAGLLRLGLATVFHPPHAIRFGQLALAEENSIWAGAAFLLSVLFSMNLLLAIFNMLPLPPLDGSGALPLLLDDKTTDVYLDFMWSNPTIGWVGLFIAWQIFGGLFRPIFQIAAGLLYF
ncbi:MAG: site-2 protease family protein [Sulfurifustaceae bacterium]